ncbi:MAG TPA: putative maltokinase, partial [Vicinamibacterales bacterium]|nr:putative maltokinase [Vicinamibacterales bacterium]
LARTVQPVEIPMPQFAGLTPVEMLGQTEFPRITEAPYFLTLAPYGFYWFQLQEAPLRITQRTAPVADDHAAVPALFAGVVWDTLLDGSLRGIVERQALVPFLQRQRWFLGKARAVRRARFVDWATVRRGAHPAFITIVEVEYADGPPERYLLPLAMAGGQEAAAIEQHWHIAVAARITGARKGLLYDGLYDDGLCAALVAAVEHGHDIPMRGGRLRAASPGATPIAARDALAPISRTAPDQSNTSVLFGRQIIMKTFRRVEPGPNPDVEIGAFLAARGFSRVPPFVGALAYDAGDGAAAEVALLQRFVVNQGNAWDVTIEELKRYFELVATRPDPPPGPEEARRWIAADDDEPPPLVAETLSTYLTLPAALGRRTGELHAALASSTDPAFAPESCSPDDLRELAAAMRSHADERLALLEASLPRLDERRRDLARRVLERRADLLRQFDDLPRQVPGAARIRCHGDYHLGQVLVAEGDIVIIDFEGEPARPLAARRAKSPPLRDVASMLRSFSYAALLGLEAAVMTRPEDLERLAPWADFWESWVSAVFLRAYLTVMRETPLLPQSSAERDALLDAFVLDKALYELGYELNTRPDWVHIPLAGLLRLGSPLIA